MLLEKMSYPCHLDNGTVCRSKYVVDIDVFISFILILNPCLLSTFRLIEVI
jgi:hypothetical protein